MIGTTGSGGISYIPMSRGYLYLVTIMDWASRKVLSWRLFNTMDADFCADALEESLQRYSKPGIFNTDQGSQFTSDAFINIPQEAGSASHWMAEAAGWKTS